MKANKFKCVHYRAKHTTQKACAEQIIKDFLFVTEKVDSELVSAVRKTAQEMLYRQAKQRLAKGV